MKYVYRSTWKRVCAAALDTAGGVLRGKSSYPPAEPDRILVVRLDHLGDILLTTGMPKALKEAYPSARVDLLVPSWGAPLFENNPFVDDVLTYDAPWFAGSRFKRGSKRSWGALAGELRRRRYAIGLSLRGDAREHLLLRLGKVRYTIGYGITGGGFLLSRVAPYLPGRHELDRRADLLRELGVRSADLGPKLYFRDDEDPEQLLSRLGVPAGRPRIGLQIGAGATSKTWSDDKVAEFVRLVGSRHPGAVLVLLGTRSPRLPDTPGLRVADLTGRTGIRELCVSMRGLDAVVGYDSGPTHLASVLDVPTLFLYSGVNRFEEWKPLAESARVLRRPVDCSPCELTACPIPGHPCLEGIQPSQAAEELGKMLA